MINRYQTGDVLYFPLGYRNAIDPIAEEIPKDAVKRSDLILQKGRTGNTHALVGEGTTIWTFQGKTFIDVKNEATAVHGEHHDVKLPAGKYEVRNVQEENVFTGMRAAVVD